MSVGTMVGDYSAPRRLISEREAAAYLGPISVRTLQEWRNRGVGPAYSRLGRRIAYDTQDLDAFVASQRVEPKIGAAS